MLILALCVQWCLGCAGQLTSPVFSSGGVVIVIIFILICTAPLDGRDDEWEEIVGSSKQYRDLLGQELPHVQLFVAYSREKGFCDIVNWS